MRRNCALCAVCCIITHTTSHSHCSPSLLYVPFWSPPVDRWLLAVLRVSGPSSSRHRGTAASSSTTAWPACPESCHGHSHPWRLPSRHGPSEQGEEEEGGGQGEEELSMPAVREGLQQRGEAQGPLVLAYRREAVRLYSTRLHQGLCLQVQTLTVGFNMHVCIHACRQTGNGFCLSFFPSQNTVHAGQLTMLV